MKTIDTLVLDIENTLLSGVKDIPQEDLDKFCTEMVGVLKNALSGPRQGPSYLRMSNIGKPCERQLWYSINDHTEAEPLSASTLMKFLIGHTLEHLLLFLAKQAGHTVEGTQDKQQINGVEGSRDCVIDGVVVDAKSASSFSFKKFAEHRLAEDDAFGYIGQIQSYIHAGQDDPIVTDKTRGAFLVIDKTLGHICLDIHPYDSSKDYDKWVDQKRGMVQAPQPPKRAFEDEAEGKSGNRKLGTNCSYCATPDTPILMSDLTWKEAGQIKEGDRVVGFKSVRDTRYEHTTVIGTKSMRAPCYKVVTDQGEVVVSEDHEFLTTTPTDSLLGWRSVSKLRPGYKIKYFGKPWKTEETFESGYLRGFLDGEGCWVKTNLSWAQNPGPVSDYVEQLMVDRGFDNLQRYVKNSAECKTFRLSGGYYQSLKAVGTLRPLRLLDKASDYLDGLSVRSWQKHPARILSIQFVGEMEVAAIKTENSTLITNGFLSHNCDFKYRCWTGLKMYPYARGPVFLTKVVKEPRVGMNNE